MRAKNFILASGAAAALLMAAGAAAAEPNGWYGAIDAGWHGVDDVKVADAGFSDLWELEVEDGWAASGRPDR